MKLKRTSIQVAVGAAFLLVFSSSCVKKLPGAKMAKSGSQTSNVTQDPENVSEDSYDDSGIKVSDPPSEARSVAVSTYAQILPTMEGVTGRPASAACRKIADDAKSSFSLDGAVKDVSAPMWMKIITLASCVCNDLVEAEAQLDFSRRLYFRDVDFSATQASVDFGAYPGVRDQVIERITTGFFGRKPLDAEKVSIAQSLRSAGILPVSTSKITGAQAKTASLFICSAALSSIASQKK